ncbi:Crp/Fnr family transcriptional regulator [Primorskyibacter sp. S87]|uniref:Crp/Fnr family transcriptional regulator n=1 Tax=Primorskyibacter sp. S87 TaxID=3415126 RepID=UPI003C7A55CD
MGTGHLTPEHKNILRGSGWLAGRSPSFQDAFLELGTLMRLEAGQVLYQRGRVPTHAYGLIQGQIDVQLLAPTGEELVYPSGSQARWYSFPDVITQEPAAGITIARQQSLLLCISRSELMRFLSEEPSRYIDMIAHDNELRRNLQEVVAEVVSVDGVELVARRLVWMIEADRLDTHNAVAISQREFASAAGISVPTVQRAFRDLKRKGLLETYYGKIVIKDPDSLARFAETLGVD